MDYEFDVKASAKEVYEVLADVPTSASFYPGVDQLIDQGDGVHRWEMKKIGLAQISLQTVYTSKYVGNKAKRTVVWTPLAGQGNALVSGSWKITNNKNSTNVVLSLAVVLIIPLLALMKPVVAPVVKAEFEKLTEQYIDNLVEHFGSYS